MYGKKETIIMTSELRGHFHSVLLGFPAKTEKWTVKKLFRCITFKADPSKTKTIRNWKGSGAPDTD